MFEKLRKKWQVSGWNLFLILSTFALGGSACGRIGTKILNTLPLEKGLLWGLLYILLITLLWPVCVLIISIPLGQYRFFRNYISRIWGKMIGKKSKTATKHRLAIFASGKGSNTLNIINFFQNHPTIEVALVVTSSAKAGVNQVARTHSIHLLILTEEHYSSPGQLLKELSNFKIDFIVLAGFLQKIPVEIIDTFRNKIINIHPALLPQFGGKGMYGSRVHRAVIQSDEKKSGISIHWVDEEYDHGTVIFQATCDILPEDDADSLEKKVRALELEHYPRVIADTLKSKWFVN